LNPGVATEHFAKDVVPYNMRSAYYLVFGAHVFYKRHDFAVSLFSKHPEISLVVAGHGPELNNLKILAGANIRFVEDPSADEVNELYKNALGLIFPGIEDFGMVPVEAMAAGCPVFAYGVGGVRDSVEENVTGMFFTSYLEQDCWRQFELFRKHPWDSVKISSSVTRFSKSEFKRKFSAHVLQAVAEKQNRKTLSIESRSL
jgi:glycosyltransferase involved in cell wall biosynthesis